MDMLFGRHYQACLRTARSIVRNEDDAQDVVQSACCAALQHLDTFREESSFRTWFTRIVINHSLIRLRDRFRQFVPLNAQPSGQERRYFTSHETPIEELVYYRETTAMIFQTLPPSLRRAYVMHAFAELSASEIGEALGITVSAVKARLHRARRELRSSFERQTRRQNLLRLTQQIQ